MAKDKKNALGTGLEKLIRIAETPVASVVPPKLGSEIQVASIETNPFQPRTQFDEETLQELAVSIRQLGVVQPITVRRIGESRYQLIAGERRLRAAQIAGLASIPAYIRDVRDEGQMLELALIENIQREDLNAIDVALSYQRLIEECSLTQEILSERVGKKRPTITNYLRLLRLPPEIQVAVRSQLISTGHAKALVNVENPELQLSVFRRILQQGLSVRQTEELAQKKTEIPQSPAHRTVSASPAEQSVVSALGAWLQRAVSVRPSGKGRGNIVIPYSSEQDLHAIGQLLETISPRP